MEREKSTNFGACEGSGEFVLVKIPHSTFQYISGLNADSLSSHFPEFQWQWLRHWYCSQTVTDRAKLCMVRYWVGGFPWRHIPYLDLCTHHCRFIFRHFATVQTIEDRQTYQSQSCLACPSNSRELSVSRSRYRKVASDECAPNSLTDRFNPVQATCPMIAPRDIAIEVVGGNVVAVNAEVTFHLTQEQVWINTTWKHREISSPSGKRLSPCLSVCLSDVSLV